jgi:hypothetical protein
MNVTTFGKRVFGDVIKPRAQDEVISNYWSGPKSNAECLCEKRRQGWRRGTNRGEGNVKMEAEIGAMRPQDRTDSSQALPTP